MSTSFQPAATATVTLSSFPETLMPETAGPSQPPGTSHLPSILGQTSVALALTRASAWDGSGSAASAATSTMSFFIGAPSPFFS
jgi:hypothetical protein